MNTNQPRRPINLMPLLNRMGSLAAQIAAVSFLLILGAVFGGQWLDKLFGTGHLILIALVVAAGPLSLFLTFHLAMRAVRQLPPIEIPQPHEDRKDKEDASGE